MNIMINLKDLDEKLYVSKKQNEVDKLLSKGKLFMKSYLITLLKH